MLPLYEQEWQINLSPGWPFGFVKLNAAKFNFRDRYHLILTLTWLRFAALVLAVYILINIVFASLYSLSGKCIAELPPGSFYEAFFFSVETLATVGYGHMYPDTFYGHFVTTAEIVVGMFGMAAITGLIFVRFSRPTARILFSKSLVISPFDGVPALMLRIANQRHIMMAEAEFRLMLFIKMDYGRIHDTEEAGSKPRA